MKRTELSINSKYSGNSLVDLKELLSTANKLELEGIAITDFYDVNSFYELDAIIKDYPNLDIIYGTKLEVIYKDILIKTDILVRNKQGLNNLYKILTLEDECDTNIDIYNLFDYSEGLLIGINVTNYNVYEHLKNLKKENIYEFTKVFDYIIINPSDNNDYVKKIVEMSNYYHKLLVASSDVRYLDREDKIYYEILRGKRISSNNYLMSTEEMIDEFNYLNELDREKIVINDPHKISLLIDKHIPLISKIEYSKENNKKVLKNRIFKKANELYKNKIPKSIRKRIEDELLLINEINAYNILINSKLVSISENKGYVTSTRGSIASSYINYLLGITKVNPLDYDLDYHEFFKDANDSILRLTINYDERVVKYLRLYMNKEFGSKNIVRCGIIENISNSTIINKIRNYEKKNNVRFNDIEIIKNKLSKVKRSTGRLAGSYFCLPKDIDNYIFSPLINIGDLTTMIDYKKLQDNLLKITILHTSYNAIISDLMKITKIKNIDLDDSKVWNYISSSNVYQIFNDQNIKKALEKNKVTNIKELASLWLDVHQTSAWTPSMAHAIEYALMYYKTTYIEYYDKDDFNETIRNYIKH